jgi:alkylhydroperoxidase family enzyme
MRSLLASAIGLARNAGYTDSEIINLLHSAALAIRTNKFIEWKRPA